MVYIFAGYEFDTEQHELRQAGTPLQMAPQVFVLLAYLIQHRERAISKQELLEQVWPQAFVSEAALTTCIKIARRTLGDMGRTQHIIKTVYGHGYRFIASVEESSVHHAVLPLNPAKVSIPPVALARTNATPNAIEPRLPPIERRQLTVLVARVTDLAAAAESLGPEDLGPVIGEAHAVCAQVIQRFEGHLVQSRGEELMAYFGYPQAHEDGAHRAVHTALEILHRLLRFRAGEPPQSRLRKLEWMLAAYELDLPKIIPLVAALLSLPAPARYTPLHLMPQQQRQQLLEALLTWLLKEAERRPVCCIVEDLQWVDPSTLELLHLCVERAPSCHLFLVLLFRPDFQLPWSLSASVTYLTLNPLDQSQARIMITQLTRGQALPADISEQLVDKTDGVPLFLEACTKAVLAADGRWETEGREARTRSLLPLAIPAILQDSLTARLDRLGSAKEVARIAAAIGREFTYEVLTAVTYLPLDELEVALHHLVEAECLVRRGHPPHQRYRFKHALVQEAAYASLLKRTRQQLHSRIALALAESAETVSRQPELVAYHYTEAGLPELAISYWHQIGRRTTVC